ncbi:hypothetical protein BJF87_13700 [Gordonia sp. CNJ-863]|nr:hypothetical protein BJF87_13700 [Gordonia sp. CNJ-863]
MSFDYFHFDRGIEDYVKIDSREISFSSAELVESHFHYREYGVKILKPPVVAFCDNSLVSVEEPVVIDADNADIFREFFQVVNEPRPRFVGISTVALDN